MNTATISGNLTADPELTWSGDLAICKFGLAWNERKKVGDDWTDKAHFFDVTIFGRKGEIVAEKAEKGNLVFVSGRMDFGAWEDGEGKRRTKVGIVAQSVEGEFQFKTGSGSANKGGELPATDAPPAPKGDDDDIPF